MRSLRLLIPALACAGLLLTGCGSENSTIDPVAKDPSVGDTPSPEPAPAPTGPIGKHPEPGSLPAFDEQNYTYTYSVSCFCANMGTITVVVEDGVAVSGEFVEQAGRGQDPEGVVPDYRLLTIQDMIDAANKINGKEGELTVKWPAGQAYPASLYIDASKMAADEEIGYTIEDVTIG